MVSAVTSAGSAIVDTATDGVGRSKGLHRVASSWQKARESSQTGNTPRRRGHLLSLTTLAAIQIMRLSPQPRYRFYGTPRNYLDVSAAILSGRIGRDGIGVGRLEQRVCEWMHTSYALALPQARLGLYLALRCLIHPGQAVIVSPYTFYEVINTVIYAGGRPVFTDIDPLTCGIDARQLEEQIDSSTGAVIATYMHGLAVDIEAIAELCRFKGVALIEDAAQCLGGRVGGRFVGTFGDVGVLSFSIKKNVNTFIGGMSVTADKRLQKGMNAVLSRFATEKAGRFLKQVGMSLLGDFLTAPLLFHLLTFPLYRYLILGKGGRLETLLRKEGHPALRQELPEHYKRRMTGLQAHLAELEAQTRK